MVMKINEADIKLSALAGLPTILSGITIQPVVLREIARIGYESYQQYLSITALQKEHLLEPQFADSVPEHIAIYDVIEMFGSSHPLYSLFYTALRFLIGTDNIYYENGLFINDVQVDIPMYQQLIRIIQTQNCVPQETTTTFAPATERVRMLQQKMQANRQKIRRLKNEQLENQDAPTFYDLVSSLCSHANGIHIFNVFDLNIFQFNDQFYRMKLVSDYELNIQALLHGADSKHIKLKHWISKS